MSMKQQDIVQQEASDETVDNINVKTTESVYHVSKKLPDISKLQNLNNEIYQTWIMENRKYQNEPITEYTKSPVPTEERHGHTTKNSLSFKTSTEFQNTIFTELKNLELGTNSRHLNTTEKARNNMLTNQNESMHRQLEHQNMMIRHIKAMVNSITGLKHTEKQMIPEYRTDKQENIDSGNTAQLTTQDNVNLQHRNTQQIIRHHQKSEGFDTIRQQLPEMKENNTNIKTLGTTERIHYSGEEKTIRTGNKQHNKQVPPKYPEVKATKNNESESTYRKKFQQTENEVLMQIKRTENKTSLHNITTDLSKMENNAALNTSTINGINNLNENKNLSVPPRDDGLNDLVTQVMKRLLQNIPSSSFETNYTLKQLLNEYLFNKSTEKESNKHTTLNKTVRFNKSEQEGLDLNQEHNDHSQPTSSKIQHVSIENTTSKTITTTSKIQHVSIENTTSKTITTTSKDVRNEIFNVNKQYTIIGNKKFEPPNNDILKSMTRSPRVLNETNKSIKVLPTNTTEIITANNAEGIPTSSTDIISTNGTEIITKNSIEVVPTNSTEVVPTNSTEVVPTYSTEVVLTYTTEVFHTNNTEVVPTKSKEVVPTNNTEVVPTNSTEDVYVYDIIEIDHRGKYTNETVTLSPIEKSKELTMILNDLIPSILAKEEIFKGNIKGMLKSELSSKGINNVTREKTEQTGIQMTMTEERRQKANSDTYPSMMKTNLDQIAQSTNKGQDLQILQSSMPSVEYSALENNLPSRFDGSTLDLQSHVVKLNISTNRLNGENNFNGINSTGNNISNSEIVMSLKQMNDSETKQRPVVVPVTTASLLPGISLEHFTNLNDANMISVRKHLLHMIQHINGYLEGKFENKTNTGVTLAEKVINTSPTSGYNMGNTVPDLKAFDVKTTDSNFNPNATTHKHEMSNKPGDKHVFNSLPFPNIVSEVLNQVGNYSKVVHLSSVDPRPSIKYENERMPTYVTQPNNKYSKIHSVFYKQIPQEGVNNFKPISLDKKHENHVFNSFQRSYNDSDRTSVRHGNTNYVVESNHKHEYSNSNAKYSNKTLEFEPVQHQTKTSPPKTGVSGNEHILVGGFQIDYLNPSHNRMQYGTENVLLEVVSTATTKTSNAITNSNVNSLNSAIDTEFLNPGQTLHRLNVAQINEKSRSRPTNNQTKTASNNVLSGNKNLIQTENNLYTVQAENKVSNSKQQSSINYQNNKLAKNLEALLEISDLLLAKHGKSHNTPPSNVDPMTNEPQNIKTFYNVKNKTIPVKTSLFMQNTRKTVLPTVSGHLILQLENISVPGVVRSNEVSVPNTEFTILDNSLLGNSLITDHSITGLNAVITDHIKGKPSNNINSDPLNVKMTPGFHQGMLGNALILDHVNNDFKNNLIWDHVKGNSQANNPDSGSFRSTGNVKISNSNGDPAASIKDLSNQNQGLVSAKDKNYSDIKPTIPASNMRKTEQPIKSVSNNLYNLASKHPNVIRDLAASVLYEKLKSANPVLTSAFNDIRNSVTPVDMDFLNPGLHKSESTQKMGNGVGQHASNTNAKVPATLHGNRNPQFRSKFVANRNYQRTIDISISSSNNARYNSNPMQSHNTALQNSYYVPEELYSDYIPPERITNLANDASSPNGKETHRNNNQPKYQIQPFIQWR